MSSTAQQWLGSGLVQFMLPSGLRVRMVRPSLRRLVRYGLLPDHLTDAAMNAADPAWLTQDADNSDERAARLGEYLSWVVAWSVRQLSADGTSWEPMTLTAEQVASGAIDPADLDLIEDVALRDRTPHAADAYSHMLRGMDYTPPLDDEEVSIAGWAGFRRGQGRPAGGEDSADLAGQAQRPAAGGG